MTNQHPRLEILDTDGNVAQAQPRAEDSANARLIAAAPDLVEALQFIVKINGSTGGHKAMVEEFKFRARAALAKAGL